MAKQREIDFPFEEISLKDGVFLRTFKEDIHSDEMVWHRDREDRKVAILESNGWQIQMDNGLPTEMKPEGFFFIPKNTWHRVIKGKGDLKIIIEKL
jgi:hypothetical protein